MSAKSVIVSSSGGVDANGKHVISPVSVLSYVNGAAPRVDNTVYRSKAVDSVYFLANPLWTRDFTNIALPIQRIFDYVPMAPALIRHWLKSENDISAAICFPRSPYDMESLNPSVQILKRAPVRDGGNLLSDSRTSIQSDLSLLLFRRDIASSAELQSFDPSVWPPASYEAWRRLHTVFAHALEEEFEAMGNSRLPNDSCTLFRRMMHTHFADFGFVFGKLWWGFGLRHMVGKDLYCFMRGMLFDMFMTYTTAKPPPPTLPPFFNASTVGTGQRVCAKCLAFRLGSRQMMRCPCRQVYYCSIECQRADWKVHRVVCGKHRVVVCRKK